MTEIYRAGILGLTIALFGAVVIATPPGQWAESEGGLNWLFQLRGPLPAPENLVVVTIDRESSDRLGLPNLPRKWPRTLHAQLVKKLAEQQAALVLFDVIFEEISNPDQDRQFAAAIREAGNVVLFERLQREIIPVGSDAGSSQGQITIETRVPPIPELSNAALALAPFPLPKVPARINQTWLFKPEAGDSPTLPVVALQIYGLSLYDDLIELLRELSPEISENLPASADIVRAAGSVQETAGQLRRIFQSDRTLAKRLIYRLHSTDVSGDRSKISLLHALISTYAGGHSRYLNFYGPPRTIETIPYYRVLEMGSSVTAPIDHRLSGKAVFVGFSEQLQPEQKDGFYTVYSQDTGLDISGVEIAATAFANLLQRRPVRQLGGAAELAVVVIWGFLLGFILRLAAGQLIVPVVLGLSIIYLLTAIHLFDLYVLWIPIAVPLLWQAPLAVFGALLWKYLETHRERQNIREAFGYHLPVEVVDRLSQGAGAVKSNSEQMYGICLATDAGRYTALAEQLPPTELRNLMNRYYERIFAPVRDSGGIVSDVIGDAILAIWASSTPEPLLRRQACEVALTVIDAVDDFSSKPGNPELPTRIGLHCGDVVLGHVGAIDHYEYRAVGDIVNMATRLEGLNKQLGTRILISDQMIHGLEGFLTRELGCFLLQGKTRALRIHELVCHAAKADPRVLRALSLFSNGMASLSEQRWKEAADIFTAITDICKDDGPSHYFRHLCERHQKQPPTDWDGIVRLTTK